MKKAAFRMMARAVVGSLFFAGCVSAKFLRTDAGFVERPSTKDPEVYLDRLPAKPYRSVGILEAESWGLGINLRRAVGAAIEEAKNIGCDLIVERAIHRVSKLDRFGVLAVLPTAHQPPPVMLRAHSYSDRHEFICGVYLGETRKPGV